METVNRLNRLEIDARIFLNEYKESMLNNSWSLILDPMYFLRCIPVTWEALPQTHYTFIVINVIMWISLLVANQKDPGFLAKNTEDYHRSIKQIAYYDEWKSNRGPDILRS